MADNDFPITDLTGYAQDVQEWARRQAAQPSPDETLAKLEESVRMKYLTEPVFNAQVKYGARIIGHLFPDAAHPDALRCALLVLAAARDIEGHG